MSGRTRGDGGKEGRKRDNNSSVMGEEAAEEV